MYYFEQVVLPFKCTNETSEKHLNVELYIEYNSCLKGNQVF